MRHSWSVDQADEYLELDSCLDLIKLRQSVLHSSPKTRLIQFGQSSVVGNERNKQGLKYLKPTGQNDPCIAHQWNDLFRLLQIPAKYT